MFASADEVLKFVRDESVQFIDVRFCDLPGVMQHFTVPTSSFDADAFADGVMFDGSSIRGFQAIHESDMKLIADPKTAFVDPFRVEKTLAMNFSIVDPFTDEPYSRDPRNVAAKAEAHLRSTGIADTSYFGPEAEFYIFDDVPFETRQNAGYYFIDSVEGAWNTGREEQGGNRGYKPRYKGGYFPVSPTDHYSDLRDAMVQALLAAGIQVEKAHHEVGTGGQAEINYAFSPLLLAGDQMMKFKYILKNVAWAAGKTVTFMPKPLFGDNGSGMHCHQSLWKDGAPLFYDERGYGSLSEVAAGTSAACSITPRACWRSPTPRSTPTTGWCQASRPRSTWSTPPATAPPACGSRSPAPHRRPSGWSSGSPTRPATPTWPSPPC